MWTNAKIRDASCGIAVGTKVLVTESRVPHTSVGRCWWVYDGTYFRQVAETFGGKNLSRIVVKGKPFKDQDAVAIRFGRFMKKFAKVHKSTTFC